MDICAADRNRLENEQHPAGEIGIGVFVPTNLPSEIVKSHRLAENVLNAWGRTAKDPSDHIDRRPRGLPRRALEHDHEVVITLARDLVPAPRARQDNGRVSIRLDRLKCPPALAKSTVGLASRISDVREMQAGRSLQSRDSPFSTHT